MAQYCGALRSGSRLKGFSRKTGCSAKNFTCHPAAKASQRASPFWRKSGACTETGWRLMRPVYLTQHNSHPMIPGRSSIKTVLVVAAWHGAIVWHHPGGINPLMDVLILRRMVSEQVGPILATLYTSVHNTPPPPDVVSLRDWIDAVSRTSRDIPPEHIATGVPTLIDRLPPEDRLCHTDLHPGTVTRH